MTAVALTDVATGERWVVDTTPDPLQQTETWTTACGDVVALADMDDRHAERLIAFLRRRAGGLHRRAVQRMFADLGGPFAPRGDFAQDSFEHELHELVATVPREWLEETPLVRALKAELVMRHEPWGVAA